jgi:phosphate transport system protein
LVREYNYKIGGLAENQVAEAVKAVLSEPVLESKEVKQKIRLINSMLKSMISARVFLLCNNLLLQIRFIISAMQISREIERVGDLSMSIMKLTKSIKEKHELISKFNIADIVRSRSYYHKTNECFQNMDETSIEEIFKLNSDIKSSDAIDNIIEMKHNSKTVVSGTNLVIALKHFERIADHSTNIAESVFLINAKTIKHEKFSY